MSRTITDSTSTNQMDVSSLVESYLFDFPDHAHLEQRKGEVWPAEVLNNGKMQWGSQRGSLLHKACQDGRLSWVNALIERGADPWQAAASDGLPPAGWAARGEQGACFLTLLMYPGRCPNPPTQATTNLFHLLMAQRDLMMTQTWLAWWESHGDPLCVPLFDRPDAEGRHPTHVVADRLQADPGLLSQLLDLGFSHAAQDRCGRSPSERMVWQHPELIPPTPEKCVDAREPRRFRRRQAAG
jgi:hypothetical protein